MSVRELERFHELLFRHFLRGAFNHDDVVFRADVNQIEIAVSALVVRWVRDELAIHATHAHRANRAGKWNVGNAERGGRAVDRENIRIVLSVGAEQDRNDLRVVEITRGKERPERPIRHARGERFFFGRPAFAFEIAAGKFSDRRCFFAVIDGERKPILSFLDLGRGDRADEHHGVAGGDDDRAVGELGDFAGFD